jgi:WD40 repeat protein
MRRLGAVVVLLLSVPVRAAGPLPDGALARVGDLRGRLPGTVTGLAFGTDGQSLYAAAAAGGLCTLDPATVVERARLDDGPARVLAPSPDGTLLAAADAGGTVRLWECAPRRERWVAELALASVAALAVAPDGRTVAAGGTARPVGGDGMVSALVLFDAGTGRMTALPTELRGEVTALAWSPNGAVLAAGGHDGRVELWQVDNRARLRDWDAHHQSVFALAFAAGGRTLASAGKDFRLRLWDPATGVRRAESPVNELFTALIPLPGGRVLAAIANADAWLLDAATGAPGRRLRGPGPTLTALAVSGDGAALATGDLSGGVRVWDVATGRVRAGAAPLDPVRAVAVSPDGRTVALARAQTVTLCDPDGANVRDLPGHQTPVTNLAFCGRGLLASASEPGDERPLRLWVVARAELRRSWGDVTRQVRGLAATPDGRHLVVLEPGSVTLHDARRGRFAGELPAPAEAGDFGRVAVAPDGRLLAAGGADGRRVLWDLDSRGVRHSGPGGQACRGLFFLPGGRLLWLDEGALTIWDCDADGPAEPVFGPAWMPGAVAAALSADGRSLAVARVSVIELWDVPARQRVRQFRGHLGPVRALAFTTDGRVLVSGGDDGTAIFWDATGLGAATVAAPADERQLATAWVELADADAPAARRAVWRLAAAPAAGPFLAARVRAVRESWRRMAELIAALDHDKYVVREKASRELAGLGELAEPALRRALAGRPSPEVRGRIELLLRNLPDRGETAAPSPEVLRWLRCVEVLERLGSAEARDALAVLADLPVEDVADEARAALGRMR